MECKLKFRSIILNKCGELIDTLWNVNITLYVDEYCCSGELIDTLWNVNWFRIKLSLKSCCGINRYIMECKR